MLMIDIKKFLIYLLNQVHQRISKTSLTFVNYNDGNSIFSKLTQTKEINVLELIPSFRDTSYNKDSNFKDLSLNKDNSIRDFSIKKEISFIKENENEEEKSK